MTTRAELIAELQQLQQASANLEPTKAELKRAIKIVSTFLEKMYDSLDNQPGFKHFDPNDNKFDQPFLETPTSFEEIFDFYIENVYKIGLHPQSPLYQAYVPGGSAALAALIHWLAAATNEFIGSFALSPGMVRMQDAIINLLKKELNLPDNMDGDLTSGGSLATLSAFCAARESADIVSMAKQPVAYLTSQTHHSAAKALKIVAEYALVREVPITDDFRMDPHALEEMIKTDLANGYQPWLVIATAGTTNTGAVDDIPHISTICKKFKTWLHVDAALGGFYLFTEKGRQKIPTLKDADSIVLDPHKGAGMPYGNGCVLTDAKLLKKAFSLAADYMRDSESPITSPSEKSPELSRTPTRAASFWFSLKVHGLQAFRNRFDEKLLLTEYFHEQLKQFNFAGIDSIEIISPQLVVVPFRFKPTGLDANEFNQKLLEHIGQYEKSWLSSTKLPLKGYADKQLFIRFIGTHLRTHRQHVDLTLKLIQKAVPEVLSLMKPTTRAFKLTQHTESRAKSSGKMIQKKSHRAKPY